MMESRPGLMAPGPMTMRMEMTTTMGMDVVTSLELVPGTEAMIMVRVMVIVTVSYLIVVVAGCRFGRAPWARHGAEVGEGSEGARSWCEREVRGFRLLYCGRL